MILIVSILRLTLWGGLIIFLFQSVFQGVLAGIYKDNDAYRYFHGVITMTIFGLVMSFFTAFQLKTKKTGVMVGMIAGVCVLLALLLHIFPALLNT